MRRAIFLAAVLSLLAVVPVSAAAVNDTPATAIEVFLPTTTVSQDTTLADETDPAETALNENCGAPAVEHGVWFEITPAEDTFVSLDASDSDYAAGVMLFAGTPTADGLISCGPEQIVEALSAGTTYLFMVFGDGESAATSGDMVLHVTEAAPPPEIEVTIDKSATVDRSGTVRLTGTVTCTSEDDSGTVFEIFGDITQKVGRLLIRGSFFMGLDAPCDGSTTSWEAFVSGENGVFAGGKAATVAIAFGCTDLCSEGFAQATIQLKRSGK
jgi:hypothetical protein